MNNLCCSNIKWNTAIIIIAILFTAVVFVNHQVGSEQKGLKIIELNVRHRVAIVNYGNEFYLPENLLKIKPKKLIKTK